MTALQLFRLAADIVQFAIGAYVVWTGYGLMCKRWDRTSMDYRAGQILMAIGAAICLILRVR